MRNLHREPWVFEVFVKLGDIAIFLTLGVFFIFLISSSQGISRESVVLILNYVTILSLISAVILVINIVFIFFNKKKLSVNITLGIKRILLLVFFLGIFLFINIIYTLSQGSLG
ncbi:MAG: hypothetical protein B6229_02265 [Spirochaetaceae bacterium 4572_7]|nr:MAG: hypothetical protein B6229_02265 [Spirochaetaceae bacterium 4572_7]